MIKQQSYNYDAERIGQLSPPVDVSDPTIFPAWPLPRARSAPRVHPQPGVFPSFLLPAVVSSLLHPCSCSAGWWTGDLRPTSDWLLFRRCFRVPFLLQNYFSICRRRRHSNLSASVTRVLLPLCRAAGCSQEKLLLQREPLVLGLDVE